MTTHNVPHILGYPAREHWTSWRRAHLIELRHREHLRVIQKANKFGGWALSELTDNLVQLTDDPWF
jgi:hypothetical protein